MMFDWLSGNRDLWELRAWLAGSRRARTVRGRSTDTHLAMEPLEPRELPDANHLLIGTYNTDIADQNGANRNTTYYQAVLRAIGQEGAYYTPQAPDILTVTEVRSNAVTGTSNDTEWLTQQLNALYGAGRYSHGTLNGSGGGGTQGIIYNTQTIRILEELRVGSGLTRQELRYHVRPLARPDGSADFYIYVGHYKAGSTSTDISDRNTEAMQVRANANALGPNVPILYTGDFNDTGDGPGGEPMSATLMAAGNGQAFDPINRPGHWDYNPAFVDIDTLRSTGLDGRFDELWETGAVLSSRGGSGLQDMPSTYHAFGNNGSVAYNQSVASSSNTALAGVPNRTTVLTDLTHCSDHIPVLQLYSLGQTAQATQFSVTTSVDGGSAVAGGAFDVIVTALDANGNVVPGYRGTVTFSSGDPYGATVPSNYTFTAADAGQHTFSGGATLYTAGGTWDITATDTSTGITGADYVSVTAAPATSLLIYAPSSAASGAPFDVTVYAVDPYYNVDTNYQGTISWTSTDPDSRVVLPGNYTFQTSDQGQVTFPSGVTLYTLGDQFITATDTNSGITGSADVTVTSAAPRAGGNHLLAGLALALSPARSVVMADPHGSPLLLTSTETTPAARNAGVDRFFASVGNEHAWVPAFRRPDANHTVADLVPGKLLTDLDLNLLAL
jgi:hypothetical protein